MNAWVLLSASTAQRRVLRRPFDADDRVRLLEGEALSLLAPATLPHRQRPHGSRNCQTTRSDRRRRARALRAGVRAAVEQVGALERRLSLASSRTVTARANAEAAALELVATYHRLTARGFDAERDVGTTAFLRAALDERFVHPDFRGRDMFLTQWTLISRSHLSVSVDTTSLSVVTPDSARLGGLGAEEVDEEDSRAEFVVRSRGVTTMRISRGTFEHVFPHALQDEELVQRLIGREYAFAYTFFAHVNAAGRVFQMESTVDLASALLTLLSDPFATVKMVEASTMTRGGNIALPDVVREAQIPIENGFL